MAAPTAVMVSAGEAGTATRTCPADRVGHSGVVDDWTLRPRGGRPLSLVVSRCPGGPQYALLVSHVDPEMAVTVRALGLPDEMAVEIYVLTELEVDTDQQAREVARHLARAAAAGTLPMAPVRPVELAQWRASVATVAAIMRHTWPATPAG